MGVGFTEEVFAVEIELKSDLLGTVSLSKSIWCNWVQSRQRKKLVKEGKSSEEITAIMEADAQCVPDEDEQLNQGLTGFFVDEKGKYISDYFVKGFFKNSTKMLKEYGTIKQLQSKVRNYLYIRPEKIYVAAKDEELEICERPLRCQTQMGERVSIARSETIPAGTRLSFEIVILNDAIPEKLLRELARFGEYQGLGAWRGSGKGKFVVKKFKKVTEKTGKGRRAEVTNTNE